MEQEPKPDHEKARQQHALRELFLDMYGIPYSWAVSASGMDNPLGKHWRERLNQFNDLLANDIEDGKTDIL